MEARKGTDLLRILTYTVQTAADPLAHVEGCSESTVRAFLMEVERRLSAARGAR
jgi:hypothetical protein